MALIQVSSVFGPNSVYPEITATTVDFSNIGIRGTVFVSETSSTSFSTFIGGSTPQTDRVVGRFIGTGLGYVYPISGTPVELSGTITSFTLSYTDLRFSPSSPNPVTGQITAISVSNISLPAQTLNFANLADILTKLNYGDDQIFGSLLDDIIDAGTGNDEVYGYNGNDQIYGGDGNDYLVGENGDDQLFGGNGNDWLVGGAGNDWLVGNAGYDTLIGGDGDDGIVYDAGDNIAGYNGGAGYDILFFDAAGPGNPFTINLAAQGFEQAIGTRIETGTEAWKSITTIYNQAWAATSTEFLNDDGSKSIWRFDPGNQQGWREIRDYYTAAGKLDFEQIYYDDGSYGFVDFDLANTENWYARYLRLDANGGFLSEGFTYDATITQRSTEIGAVKAAIKAAPVDALI